MIKVKLENDKAFVRMLKGYLTSTSKDAAFAVNNKLYSVALTAIKRTKKAGKKNIERMWVPDSSVVDRKSKKRNSKRMLKKSKATKPQPLAHKIVSAAKGFTRATPRSTMGATIYKGQRARKNSIGLLRSGWLPSVQKLGKHLGPLGRPKRKPKLHQAQKLGDAKPARGLGDTVVTSTAWIENRVGKLSKGVSSAVKKFGKKGLDKALREEIQDMEKYFTQKLQKSADDKFKLK